MTDDPAAFSQCRHFSLKQRSGAFNPVPVLIQDAPLEPGVFLEQDLPAGLFGMDDRITSNLVGTAKTEFEHGGPLAFVYR